jgi:hypothetical protein
VVAEIAYLWVVEQLVSTAFGDSRASYLLAATGGTRAWSSDVRSTYAESINADERTVGERNQRCEWADRADDRAVDRSGGARSAPIGRALPCSCHPTNALTMGVRTEIPERKMPMHPFRDWSRIPHGTSLRREADATYQILEAGI